jgi:hypothetical protein
MRGITGKCLQPFDNADVEYQLRLSRSLIGWRFDSDRCLIIVKKTDLSSGGYHSQIAAGG